MNKKFLSAILFGALMVTSTGTFVSCKDYDEDIENLQGQVDANKNAIAALQQLVGSGNWVTGVAGGADGLVVTMSNGSTVTVPTGNGKDGKDGTEWTIGEDGYWYMDGEKTDNLAVPQGVASSVVAPSPTIENGKWVIYTWDAEKGEYVAEVTEISAAGTSSYVVLKNGAYILNIADETGEFVEISLPATAESFIVNPVVANNVTVAFAYGEWKTPTTKADKELFDKLAAEFPALKEYKDKDLVEQGGKLPFIVSPANVQLTKDHSFALVNMKGEDADATLSNPVLGMPEGFDGVVSRAVQGTAVWSLDFVPALDEDGEYVKNNNVKYSLVVSGPKGIIAATPYVYKYTVNPAENALVLDVDNIEKKYSEKGIDVFAYTEDDTEHITLPYETLKGMYLLEVKDPATAEEYDIEIEGSVVKIGNMPKGKNTDPIALKLTAISVNGSVDEAEFSLTVKNEIAATGALADKDEVLAGTYKNGKFVETEQTIWWSLEDLKLSSLAMKNFYDAAKTLSIKSVKNDDTKEYAVFENKVYDSEKKETTDYTKAAYICAVIDAAEILPGNYNVVLTAVDGTSTTILKAESKLTVSNPEEDLLTVKEAYLDEEGVVIAATNATDYNFDLNNIFELEAETAIANIVDADRAYDQTTYAVEWLKANYVINAGVATWTTAGELESTEVDKVRTFTVTYNLFGNPENQKETEIKVKWASSIYAEDASVITMTAGKTSIKFDDVASTTTVAENKIIFDAITSAIYAEGPKKGTAYNLFKLADGTTTGTSAKYDYSKPDVAGTAADTKVVKGKNYVEMPKNTDALLFGMSQAELDAYLADADAKEYITIGGWAKIWAVASKYYNTDGSFNKNNTAGVAEASKIPAADKKYTDVFTSYMSLIDFVKVSDAVNGTAKYKARASEIKSVKFVYVNAADKGKYFTGINEDTDYESAPTATAIASTGIDKTSLVSGKKTIAMQMVVTDVWGKEMVYDFNIEISL